ncbi:MAG: hypothetical protein ABFS09_12855 [Thermodesulfobacteriota bacterium]
MKLKSKAVLLFSLVLLSLSTVACEKESEAEKAGKKMGKALNTAKDKISNITK